MYTMGEQKEDGDRHFLEVPNEAQNAMCTNCNKGNVYFQGTRKIIVMVFKHYNSNPDRL